QVDIGRHLQGKVLVRFRYGETASAGVDRLFVIPHLPEVVCQIATYPSQPWLVVEAGGQGFGFPEIFEDAREFSERQERVTKVEAKIDGLRHVRSRLGKTVERVDSVFEVRDRLTIRRPGRRFEPRPSEINGRTLPELPRECMVGQSLDLFGQAIRVVVLDSPDELSVEGAPPPLEQGIIGYLTGEAMLERVF